MAKGTPDEIAARWAQRLASAAPQISAGVAAVTTAPGQAAARQKAVWAQNVAQAQDKWASRVASVSLSDWQTAMTSKGVSRVASGATAAQPKFTTFMSQLLPHIASVKGSLPPRGTIDQNIARSAQFIMGMSKFQRR